MIFPSHYRTTTVHSNGTKVDFLRLKIIRPECIGSGPTMSKSTFSLAFIAYFTTVQILFGMQLTYRALMIYPLILIEAL